MKKKPSAPKRGRYPKHERTEERIAMVRGLAIAGYRDQDIAEVLGCSESMVKKAYSAELKEARKLATAKVATSLYKNAINGNVVAQIFWMKTRARWSELNPLESDRNDVFEFSFRETKQGERIKDSSGEED